MGTHFPTNSRGRAREALQYRRVKEKYLDQIRSVGLASLSRALQNTRALAYSNPAASELAERLKRNMAAIMSNTGSASSLPASWQPTFASDEQAGRSATR